MVCQEAERIALHPWAQFVEHLAHALRGLLQRTARALSGCVVPPHRLAQAPRSIHGASLRHALRLAGGDEGGLRRQFGGRQQCQ